MTQTLKTPPHIRAQVDCYQAANKDKVRASQKKWYRNSGVRWKKYHLTADQAQQMWLAQGKACAACGKPADNAEALHVDHDHACCPGSGSCGRCIRGLVCRGCNSKDALSGLSTEERDRARRLRRLANNLAPALIYADKMASIWADEQAKGDSRTFAHAQAKTEAYANMARFLREMTE